MAQLSFNVNDIPPEENTFQPLPDGWYTASINNAEVKTSKSGGEYINIRYDITGPTHQGRVVFGMVTLTNHGPNKATAESIGRQHLGKIVMAIGLQGINDTDQLIGGNLQIKLATEKNEEYGDKNKVTNWKAISGIAPVQQPMPTAPQESSPASASKPPWMK